MSKKVILFIIVLLFHTHLSFSQPKREVRAAWVTTAYRLDWPQTLANSTASRKQQKEEMIVLLDRLKKANFNTILFQVRGKCDANYNSKFEPYSNSLTGQYNGNPGYDPLKFTIEECHKRGMECHAWIVAIPSGGITYHNRLGKHSPIKKEPSIFKKYKGAWYLNPAHPQSKVYLAKIVNDIVENYDIDGIHFDYLRYPEGANKDFPDQREYRNQNSGLSLDDWRRDNITQILNYTYHEIKKIKPWVKVSTSPLGKHSDTNRYSAKGWNAYNTVYQDVFKWLEMGIQDQIYPMMYYQGNNFYPFALDWKEKSNNRHIIPGLGIYFLDSREGNWSAHEIQRQIKFVRHNQLEGHAFFRAEFLMNDVQNIYSSLVYQHYKYPALIPSMPWLDQSAPSKPSKLNLKFNAESAILNWSKSKDNDLQNEPRYIIYKSNFYPVDTTDPQNIIATYIKDTSYIYTPVLPKEKYSYYAVTAIDRYGNESEAIQLEPTHDIEIVP